MTPNRLVAVALTAATLTLASALIAPNRSDARSLSCNALAALGVNPANRTGIAEGGDSIPCTASNWYYDVQLKNNAGNILAEVAGYTSGYSRPNTGNVGCAGAIVHAFAYNNVGGAGSSDTTGTNSDCAY